MKRILAGILLAFSSLTAIAQDASNTINGGEVASFDKDNIFADLGIIANGPHVGASVTYNRKVAKWFGIGGGVQGYTLYRAYGVKNPKFVPCVFADIREYARIGKGQLFFMEDAGIDLFKGSTYSTLTGYSEQIHNNGVYVGIGLGYFYPINESGAGPYVSFKMVTDSYKATETRFGKKYETGMVEGTVVLSAGFKF